MLNSLNGKEKFTCTNYTLFSQVGIYFELSSKTTFSYSLRSSIQIYMFKQVKRIVFP